MMSEIPQEIIGYYRKKLLETQKTKNEIIEKLYKRYGMSGECDKCGRHCLECICHDCEQCKKNILECGCERAIKFKREKSVEDKFLRDLISATSVSPLRIKHDELRERLRNLYAARSYVPVGILIEILEYLMDNAKFRDEEYP